MKRNINFVWGWAQDRREENDGIWKRHMLGKNNIISVGNSYLSKYSFSTRV